MGVESGEEFRGRVPPAAPAETAGRGRTPLTVGEGVALVLLGMASTTARIGVAQVTGR